MGEPVENTVVYDLSVSPITYDFAHFLALARIVLRKLTGGEKFNIVIQHDQWRHRSRRDKAYSIEEKEWRIYNLLVQICMVTPQVMDVTVTRNPSVRHAERSGVWFHSDQRNYLIRSLVEITKLYGLDVHLFEAPAVAQAKAQKLLEGINNPAVFPLRLSNFDSDRNTETELMISVARDLEASGYTPIFIPDQENMDAFSEKGMPGKFIREAAYNLPLRLALHEIATVSICSSSGPTALLALARKKPRLVIVRPIVESSVDSTEEKFRAQGFDVGSKHPLPWTPENQIYLWDDTGLQDKVLGVVEELCRSAR